LIQDNARWDGFEFRPSDVVISTPPKCGTTWTQMLCALLIFDGPEFPAPLSQLSPWLDQSIRPLDDVYAAYDSQQHRRFIKTHTPLDGFPVHPDVTYVVVGRDPRDVMVSMEHHFANMDLERVLTLRGRAVGNDDLDTLPPRPPVSDDPTERFRTFVQITQYTGAVNLTQVLHHLDTAWQRRDARNIVMCHYADYAADLPGEVLRLAHALDINLTDERAHELAAEATLDRMRARAVEVIPNAGAIWKDDQAFLRAGAFGEWRARVNDDDLVEYDATVAAIASPDLATWAHQGRLASGIDPAST
jgi:sulfotransferase family protein